MVMVMADSINIDSQGRIVIPKRLRDKKGLKGELEIIETREGILLRPIKDKSKNWSKIFKKKLHINPQKVGISISDEGNDNLWL